MMTVVSRLPPLESLRVFEAAARHLNFSRAAAELSVTPAAVSLRIQTLQAELGVLLFARSGPRIWLTPAGAALAARMAGLMDEVRIAVDQARSFVAPIRLTAGTTIAARWLGPRLARAGARGDLEVALDVSDDLRPPQEADLWFRAGVGPWPGLEGVALFPVEQTPMLSPGLASALALRTPADLVAAPLFPDEAWGAWFGAAGVALTTVPTSSPVRYRSQAMAADAAIEGAGVALLSPKLFGPLLESGRLVSPFDVVLRGPAAYHLLWRAGDTRRSLREVVDWLVAEARGEASASGG